MSKKPRKPRKRGRLTKLTAETQEAILRDLKAGLSRACSAERNGVAESTMALWMQRGREEDGEIYVRFSEEVKRMEREAEARNVIVIQMATKTQWTAAAWWLERKFPETWARDANVKVDMKGEVSHEHSGNIAVNGDLTLSADDVRATAAIMELAGLDLRQNGGPQSVDSGVSQAEN